MRYLSTRGAEKNITSAEAIVKGLAGDGGLFVPENIPELPMTLENLPSMKYKEVAKKIIGVFFDDFTEKEIEKAVNGAYDEKFHAEDIVSVKKIKDGEGSSNPETAFLELYHGKTAAFKDMALSILPYLMTTACKKLGEDKKICILTATSGDTGKAALEGFADVPGTEVVVFYPEHGVSKIQKMQMITQGGGNTHVFGINGNFDDAQKGVKRIFKDDDLINRLEKKGIRLSSANSINIGRLIPQVAYYVYGYGRMAAMGMIGVGDSINIAVPTGNFGNILAAYYAKKMGLPINMLICASNKNRILTDFINTGEYDSRRELFTTITPSMDILVSSNLERLLFDLSGEDSVEIVALMTALEQRGVYRVKGEIKERLKCFYGGYADEDETEATIGGVYRGTSYLMDPHTAVAYKVYGDYRRKTGDDRPVLIASTASPYKFAASIGSALGMVPTDDEFTMIENIERETGNEIPYGLKDIRTKKIRHNEIIEIEEMMETIEKIL